MTDLVKMAASLPKIDGDAKQALADSFENDGDKTGSDGVLYVSFSGKSGEITYGQDKEDLDQEETFVLLTPLFKKGWTCWKNKKPIARVEWSAFKPGDAVPLASLSDHGPYEREDDGWQAANIMEFMGADGTQYQFSTNSKSGRSSVKKLVEEFLKQGDAPEQYALFQFTREKFLAKGDWNWKPKFVILDWITAEEAAAFVEGEAEEAEKEPEVAPEPPKRTRRTRRA